MIPFSFTGDAGTTLSHAVIPAAGRDRVHLMSAAAQIPVGAATKEANAPAVFAALEGPVLVELDGTAACRINLAAASRGMSVRGSSLFCVGDEA